LLAGQSNRKVEIIQWPEFLALPAVERARILRIMATHASGDAHSRLYIQDWLSQSHKLNPSDWRVAALRQLNRFSPSLFQYVTSIRRQPTSQSPLGDVFAE